MGDGPGVGCVGPGSNRELAWGWKGIGMEFILLEAPWKIPNWAARMWGLQCGTSRTVDAAEDSDAVDDSVE